MKVDAFTNPNIAKDLQDVSLSELQENVSRYDVSAIAIDPTRHSSKGNDWVFTSPEHPLVIGSDISLGEFLGIDSTFYNEHKDELDSIIAVICATAKDSRYFHISKDLVTEKNLRACTKNPVMKYLSLGFDDYELKVEDYELLKDSNIAEVRTKSIVPELKNIYGSIIDVNNRELIFMNLKYDELIKAKDITIESPVTERELDNLKYANNLEEITISGKVDFKNSFAIIDRMESLGFKPKYKFLLKYEGDYDYKNEFSEYLFNHLEYLDNERISVTVGNGQLYPLKTYAKNEKRLLEMIKPALDMSPFEKYLFAYNIAKKFKKYKEKEKFSSASRNLYEVLDSDYIVCRGFVTLLSDLLTKLGIQNDHYGTAVDIGYDHVDNDTFDIPDDAIATVGNHDRIIVNIVDPKYGIDGIYLADPTWDNKMDEDAYNYALLTHDEYDTMDRRNFMNIYNENEMFFVHSLEEFYQKANMWMDKYYSREIVSKKKNLAADWEGVKNQCVECLDVLEKIEPESVKKIREMYANVFKSTKPTHNVKDMGRKLEKIVIAHQDNPELVYAFNMFATKYVNMVKDKKRHTVLNEEMYATFARNMLNFLKNIDAEFYKTLTSKYYDILRYDFVITDEYMSNFMFDVGTYITSKVNKEVTGQTMKAAITEIYRKTTDLPEEELEKKIDDIMAYNRRRQRECFPLLYKMTPDGVRIPYMNEKNKFELEDDLKLAG